MKKSEFWICVLALAGLGLDDLLDLPDLKFEVVRICRDRQIPKIGYKAMYNTKEELDLGDDKLLTRTDGEKFEDSKKHGIAL